MKVNEYQYYMTIIEGVEDPIDRLAMLISFIYNKSYEEVNNMHPKTFTEYGKKIDKLFKFKKWWFFKSFNTDAEKLDFGQFVSCIEWLKRGEIQALNLIVATLKKSKNHKKTAKKISEANCNYIVPRYKMFLESFGRLIEDREYLFPKQKKKEIGISRPAKDEHLFEKQFGWIYSAKEIAEYKRIKLDEAYELNVVEALNILTLLKCRADYLEWQSEK